MELKLTINGKKVSFKKNEFTLKDNIIGMKFFMKQSKYYASEELQGNPEEYEKVQLELVDTVVKMFNNEFTSEELLNGLSNKDLGILDTILTESMGGKADDEKK